MERRKPLTSFQELLHPLQLIDTLTFKRIFAIFTCLNNALMMMTTKSIELYEAPTVEVVVLKYEGVICTSGEVSAKMDWKFEETDI